MNDVEWPAEFDRTPTPDRRAYPGGFEVSRREAFNSILKELEKMDVYNVDIQTNAPHTSREPHRPYKNCEPADPAVVVYFERDGQRFAVPCDRWNNLRDNARAIAKYLDAKRAIERYGVATVETEMSTQALPEGEDVFVADDGTRKEPHEVLEVAPDAGEEVVTAAARRKAANVHPDRPDGDREAFKRVQDAKSAMLGEEER